MAVTMQVLGAARTVTGLQLLFETGRTRVLVDCGMFQGPKSLKALNYEPFPYDPGSIACLLLTHAHVDHAGLIPKLVKAGFPGPVYATRATVDLCSALLPDSGHIQEMEVEALNRRNARRGHAEVTPIYTAEDARAALSSFRPVDPGQWLSPAPGVRARYWNAGHILGSASIELELSDGGDAPVRVMVSGDIGPDAAALQRDPEGPSGFDWVVLESTYGDEDRPATDREARRDRLAAIVREAWGGTGVLLIPAFAVERTQEIALDLVELMRRQAIPRFPVFVDSPLAIRATEVFLAHAAELDEGIDLAAAFRTPELRFTETADESKAIARIASFHAVIAASGMCEAGRIRHHLKRWLHRRDATVLLAGFQAEGTLGRLLQDGVRAVRIQGEESLVRARIRRIDDYSGHADAPELLAWLAARGPVARGVALVHGEPPAIDALADRIEAAAAAGTMPPVRILKPALDERIDLRDGRTLDAPPNTRPRADPARIGRLDWHNDLSRLLLDISEAVDRAADEKARGVVIRRLRRALEDE
ncbi:MBL fold metallo-hydrolase [Prosthecomicrobium sp. N25]|uniref:MBL fold metallo-hydrolase n=1 Tax=Prosthecomicrobium sp. N25 TaxID=3129254 RepID=UPI003077F373